MFRDKGLQNIRVKRIGVSIPCVTGPQISTNVNIRIGEEEFITSSGVNDSGVFKPSFNQPKYTPFEYLKLEDDTKSNITLDKLADFDFTTISDVILHVNYYADSSTGISNIDVKDGNNNSHLLMSWKHDFPLEWQLYVDGDNTIPVLNDHQIPYKLIGTLTKAIDKTFESQGKVVANLVGINSYSSETNDIWLLYR